MIEGKFPVYQAPYLNLRVAVERLREEHDSLRVELEDIQHHAIHLLRMPCCDEVRFMIPVLRVKMEVFLSHLTEHECWEETELLPLFNEYASQAMSPTYMNFKWMMEEDHKQAERFIRSFLEGSKNFWSLGSNQMKEAATLLSLACSVVSGHLKCEQDMLYPIAEHILTESSYSDH